jgi:transcriptional regulator with XRE-family HTH domain
MGRPLKRIVNERYPGFAQRLRALMEKRDIETQSGLAKLVGTTPGEVGHWLRGERMPTLRRQWERLCEVLGVDVDYLMFGYKEAHKKSFVIVLIADGEQKQKIEREVIGKVVYMIEL